MRRTRNILIALALAALLIPAAADAKVPKSFFGITAAAPTSKDFRGMGKTGFGTFRLQVNWRAIQKTRKGDYKWAYPDAYTRAAAENGMSTTMLLFGTPRFVHKSKSSIRPPTKSKQDLREWQQFARAAAKRYGPGGDFWAANPDLKAKPVRRWMIWNEQNARNYWQPRPDPRAYAKLVKVSDKAISGVDPHAEISLGGMYCCPHDGKRSLTSSAFLKRFYRVKGIERHFDVLSVHPYGSGVSAVKNQIAAMHEDARRAGDRNAKILVGELGWASKGPSWSPPVVGKKGQASRLKRALKLLVKKRNAWNILGVYVYLWRDFDPSLSACRWCPGAGLVKKNGKPKPARRAVRGVIRGAT
jgi:hypothetical protein